MREAWIQYLPHVHQLKCLTGPARASVGRPKPWTSGFPRPWQIAVGAPRFDSSTTRSATRRLSQVCSPRRFLTRLSCWDKRPDCSPSAAPKKLQESWDDTRIDLFPQLWHHGHCRRRHECVQSTILSDRAADGLHAKFACCSRNGFSNHLSPVRPWPRKAVRIARRRSITNDRGPPASRRFLL